MAATNVHNFSTQYPELFQQATAITHDYTKLSKIYENVKLFAQVSHARLNAFPFGSTVVYFDDLDLFLNSNDYTTIPGPYLLSVVISGPETTLVVVVESKYKQLKYVVKSAEYCGSSEPLVLGTTYITTDIDFDITCLINALHSNAYCTIDNLQCELADTQELLHASNRPTVYAVAEKPFTNRVKIGSTHNMENTLRGLQCGNPSKLMVLNLLETPLRRNVEKQLHSAHAGASLGFGWYNMNMETANSLFDDIDN